MAVVVAPEARRDIAGIIEWSEENFGIRVAKRYARLIAEAIEQISENPAVAGSRPRPEIAEHSRTYHLHFSCKFSGATGNRIRKPRHFLLYRVDEKSNAVEIGRVLHDSMDLSSNLPEAYLRSPKRE